MKIFALALLMISSLSFSSAFAAERIEVGTYKAKDVDSGTIDATLTIQANKTVNFKLKTTDFEMPEPGCEGTYAVTGDLLTADMVCPFEGLEKIEVKIDIKNVTPDTVVADPGALVEVAIDALGSDSYKFYLKKIK